MRRFRILTLLLVLGVVASACSTFSKPPAATIDGHEVSVADVEHDIDALLGNKAYATAVEQVYGFTPKAGSVKGAFDSAFTAQMLSLRVWFDVFERDLVARGHEDILDDAEVAAAKSTPARVDQAFGEGTFDGFSKELQKEFVHQQAIVQAIQDSVTAEVGNDAKAFYDDHPDEFAEICVSHILVSVQGRTQAQATAEAEKLRQRIDDGEDFEKLAATESDDTASGADKGSVGCGSRASLQLVPEFEEAAFSLKVGEVSQPVQSQFGSHLILVTKRTVPDFDEISDVDAEMQDIASRLLNERFNGALCKADVDVNPRFGTWSRRGCEGTGQSELPRVEPPEGPIGSAPSLTPGA
jgi:foldase protein PrsA